MRGYNVCVCARSKKKICSSLDGHHRGRVIWCFGGLTLRFTAPFPSQEDQGENHEQPIRDVCSQSPLCGLVTPSHKCIQQRPNVVAALVTTIKLPHERLLLRELLELVHRSDKQARRDHKQ